MEEPRFAMPGGGTDTPGGHVRMALLATAMLLLVLLAALFTVPRRATHILRLDLGDEASIRALDPGCQFHRIDIAADGKIALDGTIRKDLIELRMALELLSLEGWPPLRIHADPELRYERFIEIVAVIKRANFPDIVLGPRSEPARPQPESGGRRRACRAPAIE